MLIGKCWKIVDFLGSQLRLSAVLTRWMGVEFSYDCCVCGIKAISPLVLHSWKCNWGTKFHGLFAKLAGWQSSEVVKQSHQVTKFTVKVSKLVDAFKLWLKYETQFVSESPNLLPSVKSLCSLSQFSYLYFYILTFIIWKAHNTHNIFF